MITGHKGALNGYLKETRHDLEGTLILGSGSAISHINRYWEVMRYVGINDIA